MSTVPLFSLLPNSGSYPPSPTFSDPPFSYDGHGHTAFTSPLDLKGSGGLGNFAFPTPPSTSTTISDNSYNARMNAPFPNLLPPTFSHPHSHMPHGHGSFPTPPDVDDPTSFLDLDLSQPGPSTYHSHSHPHAHANGRMYDQLSGSHSSGPGSAFDLDDGVGAEYVQQLSDDDEDEDGAGASGGDEDEMVKYEQNNGHIPEQGEGGEEEGDMDNEEPLYVNAKQYHRILKRRLARARLEELNRLVRSRKPYLHESRHRHACSRPRGKGGRFLTADEIEAMKKEEAEKALTGQVAEVGNTPLGP